MPLDFPINPIANVTTYSFGERTWKFNGEAWDLVPSEGIQGTQGVQGLQGIQGTQGVQGLQGLQGTQGVQGLQGIQGTQGVQGLQGLQGNQGRQGTQGLQGIQGLQGNQGVQGLQGNQGTQGLQGNQGTQGLSNQGVSGSQGNQGLQGTQGNQGTQGLQGTQGNQGTQGLQGTQGRQGTQGLQGLQGTQGNQGTQGLQGTQGNQGTQGLQGTQGNQGTQGSQGTQGLSNQGVSGSQGNQGLQGLQGNQGRQGTQGLSNQGVSGSQGNQGLQGTQGNQGTQGLQGIIGTAGTAGPSTTINATDDTATTTLYPVMVGATGSNQTAKGASTRNFVYNASTGSLGLGAAPAAKLDVRGDVYVGGNDAGPNFIAFRGTTGDAPGSYNHTYIGERIWEPATEKSELLLFKGNDILGSPGPDRIRLIASEIRLDTYAVATSGTFEGVATSGNVTNKITLTETGNLGINTTNPLQILDVRGNLLVAADATTSSHITLKPYTLNNGTLSWEGSAGQLFSITNNLTSGSIFSVNDVSGIPSIDVDANGTILFGPYGGNVGVGLTNPTQKLDVAGNIRLGSQVSGATVTPPYLSLGANYTNTYVRANCKIRLYDNGADVYGFGIGPAGDVQYHSTTSHAFYNSDVLTLLVTGTEPSYKGNTIWHAGNDGAGSGLDADLLDGQQGSYYDHRVYTVADNYLGGYYVSGGSEKPNNAIFGAGKLKIAMLSGTNLGYGGTWNDVLWISSYSGSDVKGSLALVLDKASDNLYFSRQNFDSASWGTGHKIWHAGNDGAGSGLDADLLDGLNAASTNTASTIVARDSSGNFSAGTITAALSGNASTATTLATTRTIWGQNFNGSANVTGALSSVTTITFTAEASDAASIGPTISSTQTAFDFNLADDNNNDLWRWRFTPAGSTVYNAMTLTPTANGVSNLAVAGTIEGTRLISTVATGTAPLTVSSTTVVTNLNADLLDGENLVDNAATASTVAGRDASGDIFARLIRQTFGNEATISGGIVYRVNNSTDNYLRVCSDTGAIRTFLNVPTRTGGDASGTWNISSNYCNNLTQGFNSNWNTDFQAAPAGSTILNGDTSTGSSTGGPGGTWWFQQNMRHANGSSFWGVQVAWGWEDNANKLRTRNVQNGSYGSWIDYWNSANDGSGSGLDADTLDGINSSSFARVDSSSTFTVATYFQSNLGTTLGSLSSPPLQAYSTGTNAAFMSFHRGGSYAVNFGLDSDNVLRIGGWSAAADRWQLDMSGNMTVAGTVTASSDVKLKENIEVITNALEKVSQIRGVTFTRNDQEDKEKRHAGVIAQEIEKVLPEIVAESNGIKSVAYGNLTALLIEAIKEQQMHINKLADEINELKK